MKTYTPPTIFVVAASQWLVNSLTRRFHPLSSSERAFAIQAFTSAPSCHAALTAATASSAPVALVIATDFVRAPALVRAARALAPPALVLVVALPTESVADVEPLLRAGASAMLSPADTTTPDQIWQATQPYLASPRPADEAVFGPRLLGSSEAMQRVFRLIHKAAASTITVSLRGETGTGKEEVARAIHQHSSRATHPFVPLNMAAIPRELLESELFGHERGAFTGATGRRVGYLELAHGGTLFLDEIADFDLSLQAKLLRVLQEKALTRVGGGSLIPFDARLIVATHLDLAQCVRAGQFREDLYYRLLGMPILLPPLRERPDDILLLAWQFLQEFCPPTQARPCTLTAAAEAKLLAHSYPGNVRELRAVLELASVLAENYVIDDYAIVFPPSRQGTPGPAPDVNPDLTLREHVVRIVQHYLDHYHGNVLLVAARLGIGKSTLYRMINSGQVRA